MNHTERADLMGKDSVENKLDKVLSGLNMDTVIWADYISPFCKKLELLSSGKRYGRLLRSLFSSKDIAEFNGYVFEALFAYDFESKGQALSYEVKQLPSGKSSIDFCYSFDDKRKIYFELRLVTQRAWIRALEGAELKAYNCFQIELGGNDQREEIIRLQNILLNKCQDATGVPIKFRDVSEGIYNLMVVNISEIQLTMFDEWDGLLSAYGDPAVPLFYRLGLFGLFQNLNANPNGEELYKKFSHFRETICGILFVKFSKSNLGKIYIDRNLEYLLILNNNLVSTEERKLIETRFDSLLNRWAKRNSSESVSET